MCVNLLEKFIEKCELLEMNRDECTPLTGDFSDVRICFDDAFVSQSMCVFWRWHRVEGFYTEVYLCNFHVELLRSFVVHLWMGLHSHQQGHCRRVHESSDFALLNAQVHGHILIYLYSYIYIFAYGSWFRWFEYFDPDTLELFFWIQSFETRGNRI